MVVNLLILQAPQPLYCPSFTSWNSRLATCLSVIVQAKHLVCFHTMIWLLYMFQTKKSLSFEK